MRSFLVMAIVLLAGMAMGDDRPNILLFLVDDMGMNDSSVEFAQGGSVWNKMYDTPAMERLAVGGMKFVNAYAASPVCSPTRDSLMTGKNPARSNISSWIGHGMPSNSFLLSPDWAKDGLQPGDGNVTLPSVLREAGYLTAHIGKSHFGASGTAGGEPRNLGFEVNIAGSHRGSPSGGYTGGWVKFPELYPGLEAYGADEYITDVLTVEAKKVIDRAVGEGRPFFMNMAHYAVHTPITGQGDPDYLERYQKAGRPKTEDDYAAMIASMDASLGGLLDHLKAKGIAGNTLVFFLSDNGGLSNHTRSTVGRKVVKTLSGEEVMVDFSRDRHNWPIRSGKGSGYEGGVRIPMIVGWADGKGKGLKIEAGSVCEEPVITDDFFPTVLKVAGIKNRAKYLKEIDGVDLGPLLRGEKFERGRGLVFHFPHQWYKDVGVGEGIDPFTAIRRGDWKLIWFYGDGVADGIGYDPRWELYNLRDDLSEENDVAGLFVEKREELREELLGWMREVGAQTPRVKVGGSKSKEGYEIVLPER